MSESNLIPLTMPKWGMSMATGKIVEWLVEEGTDINKGDEILEVETEKIVNAMEANDTGVLSRCVAQSGDELPVGALLGVISDGTVEAGVLDAFVDDFQSNFVPEEQTDEGMSEPEKMSIGDRGITYLKIPARNEQGKLPVVLIHGFGSDRNSWLFNMADLSEDRTLYIPDLPGYGASSKDVGEASLEFFAGIITAFMDELKIGAAHLVGHSMGAAIAATVAVTDPARAISLVLISGGGLGESLNMGFINDFVSAERRKDMKPILQKLFHDPALVTREMINEILKYKRIEGVTDALTKIVDAVFPGGEIATDNIDVFSRFDKPLKVIWGRDDQIAVLNDPDSLPDNLTLDIIDNCGHVPHMEAAKKVNELTTGFLKSLE